jgi:hypothetical protein
VGGTYRIIAAIVFVVITRLESKKVAAQPGANPLFNAIGKAEASWNDQEC